MKEKQISINLKIGICDDDICMASDIEKFVMTYCKMKSLGFDIDTYYSGDRIIKDLEERVYFDILFLDIEMKKIAPHPPSPPPTCGSSLIIPGIMWCQTLISLAE